MNFFIANAWGQGAGGGAAAPSSPIYSLGFLVVIFVLFYFLLIRPQTKRQKEHRQMLEALGTGDEVVTGGGLLGKITAVGEQFVTIEFADGVVMKVQKSTIASILPKGTMKNS